LQSLARLGIRGEGVVELGLVVVLVIKVVDGLVEVLVVTVTVVGVVVGVTVVGVLVVTVTVVGVAVEVVVVTVPRTQYSCPATRSPGHETEGLSA
jgi:hypothetical protein